MKLATTPESLIGQTIGRWTVLAEGVRKRGAFHWTCRCSCGTVRDVRNHSLVNGLSDSCGVCVFREQASAMFKKDITGMKFGSLTAIKEVGKNSNNSYVWLCKCDCGKKKEVSGSELRKGGTKTCGTCLPDNISKYRIIYADYEGGARRREIEWALSFDDFISIIKRNCHYCDSLPSNNRKTHKRRSCPVNSATSGIDRVDNSRGYTIDNCVPCCRICNTAKRDMPLDMFLGWVRKISTSKYATNLHNTQYTKNNLVLAMDELIPFN